MAANTPAEDVSSVVLRALAFQGSGVIVVQVLQATTTLIVAALIEPSQFALWGIAAVLLNSLQLIGVLGLGPALVYFRKTDIRRDNEAITSVFFTTTTLGLLGFCALFFGAPTIANFFHGNFAESDLVLLSRVMGVVFFASTLSSLPQTILEGKLRFRFRATLDSVSAVIYTGIALLLAALGAGVWSLLFARLAQTVLQAVGNWWAAPAWPVWPPRFSLRTTRQLFEYAKWLILAALLGYLLANSDNIVTARVLGAAALGAYALAYTIANIVPTFMSLTLSRVLFPVYANVRDHPEQLRSTVGLAIHIAAVVMIPTTVALALFASHDLVLVFGTKWAGAGALLPALALYGFARTASMLASTVLTASGRPRVPNVILVTAFLVAISTLWPLLQFGVTGVAWSFTIGMLAGAIVGWLAARRYCTKGAFRSMVPAGVSSALAGLVGLLVVTFVPGMLGLLSLPLFVMAYAAVLTLLDGDMRRILFLLLSPKRRQQVEDR